MTRQGSSKQRWRTFLENAEKQFVDVCLSAKQVNERWMLLPPKYNSRMKIYRYFRRYWSKEYATIMLKNLRTKEINGKLYLPAGDPGIFPEQIKSLEINNMGQCKKVKAAFTWMWSKAFLTVHYTVKKEPQTGRYVIVYRKSKNRDYRYARNNFLKEE